MEKLKGGNVQPPTHEFKYDQVETPGHKRGLEVVHQLPINSYNEVQYKLNILNAGTAGMIDGISPEAEGTYTCPDFISSYLGPN